VLALVVLFLTALALAAGAFFLWRWMVSPKIKSFEPVEAGRKPVVSMELAKGGSITLELYPDVAPQHVASFLDLVGSGFYNGLVFHRVVPGFVAQGGCPDGSGMGGPGYSLKAEFSERPHLTGTLAMARSGHPDSAGSQFYICLEPQPGLDGEYTVFGQVTEGMDLVQGIKKGDGIKEIKVLA
jgi:peptidylprolyl isomerase/peptidyl-prolyl cis-trans isomerase B (cyclophilin B)